MRVALLVVVVPLAILIALSSLSCSDDDDPSPALKSGSASTIDGGGSSSSSSSSSSGSSGDATTTTGPENQGEATYYNAEGKGACGIQTPSDYLVCAINDEQYSKENCGRCVEVTGPKGSVIVKVIDKCPGCDSGDLDLSETAFTKIATKSAGRIKIAWRFVACP